MTPDIAGTASAIADRTASGSSVRRISDASFNAPPIATPSLLGYIANSMPCMDGPIFDIQSGMIVASTSMTESSSIMPG